ncbi:MAG: Fe-S cluster biogenesis protein NfuA [Ulvibacter sp.]|jgi:Fe-S cluster biogenesis protein NfuA
MVISQEFIPLFIFEAWQTQRLKMSNLTIPLRIRAETSPADPDSIRFVLDKDVQEGALVTFRDADTAQGAPLAEALFAITGVKMVDVSGAVITVTKTNTNNWNTLKPKVADVIRSIMMQYSTPLGEGVETFSQTRSDTDIRLAVQSVLDRQANPAISKHGGNVSVTDVCNGVVSMLMSGGCQGCSSSTATLRGGVEKMIRASVPEVRDIIDVTDHAAGKTPYYRDGLGDKRQLNSPFMYNPIPDDVITVEDGKFLILPDYLAPRLGMDTKTLRANLQSGEVVSQSEAGTGIDIGKTRLIIRSSNCVWACQISADGTAHEISAPLAATKAATDSRMLRDRIRQHLYSLTAAEIPITYGKLARSMGLNPPGTIAKVTQALEAMMVEDAKNEVPFLASLVVSKVGQGNAAKGFFQQARALGREPSFGENDQDYYQREFNGAVAIVTAIA